MQVYLCILKGYLARVWIIQVKMRRKKSLFPHRPSDFWTRTQPGPLREMLLVVLYKIKVVQTSGHCLSLARKKTVAGWTSTAWKEFYFNGYCRLYSYTLTSSALDLHLLVDKPQQQCLMRSHLWCIHLFFSSFCPPPQPYTLSACPLPSGHKQEGPPHKPCPAQGFISFKKK